ncbi:MAG: tetratricopeptide repeat protein [bacterium]|nr:tetratricopeptide repeat protein [bacterium]
MKKHNLIKISLVLLFVSLCGLGCKKTQDSELIDGLDLFAREEFDSSMVVFNKILKADPENARVLFYRALNYKKVGDDEKAIFDFEKVFQLDKNFRLKEDEFLSFAEYNYRGRKDFKKAIDLFNLFIKKYPKSENVIRVYVEIADSYSLQKDFDNAILSYKQIVERYKNGKLSLEKRAASLAEDGIKFLEENSDFDRKPLSLYADMNNEKDPVKKIEMARKILEKYPSCNLADEIQFKIAKLYSVDGLNDFDQAQKEYKKLIMTYPKSKYVEVAMNSIRGIDEKYDRKTGKLRGTMH